jgi:hypothetical protein
MVSTCAATVRSQPVDADQQEMELRSNSVRIGSNHSED